MKFTHDQIAKATGGELLTGDPAGQVIRATHDSREAAPGDLFFPIIGENFDGHRFIAGAIEGGCTSFVVSDEDVCRQLLEGSVTGPNGEIVMTPDDLTVIKVANTEEALLDLAKERLAHMNTTVIGITGSTGKTSTRDMTGLVMAARYKTGVTPGNLNTTVGMPMTILAFDEDTEVAVLEMAMDKRWEIDRLCQVAPPHIALITNVGVTHIENLGSRDEIFNAKMEITTRLTGEDYLIATKGEYLDHDHLKGAYQTVLSGTDEDCAVRLSDIHEEAQGVAFTIDYQGEKANVQLPVPGSHNAYNAALALAAGVHMGISLEEGAKALGQLHLTGARLKFEEHQGVTLINDTYNASPDSMRAALDILGTTRGGQKFAVLGDMRELGPVSEEMHRAMGAHAASKGLAGLYAFGPECAYLIDEAGMGQHYENEEAALKALCDDLVAHAKSGDVILFKGSRGMQVERVLEDFKTRSIGK